MFDHLSLKLDIKTNNLNYKIVIVRFKSIVLHGQN